MIRFFVAGLRNIARQHQWTVGQYSCTLCRHFSSRILAGLSLTYLGAGLLPSLRLRVPPYMTWAINPFWTSRWSASLHSFPFTYPLRASCCPWWFPYSARPSIFHTTTLFTVWMSAGWSRGCIFICGRFRSVGIVCSVRRSFCDVFFLFGVFIARGPEKSVFSSSMVSRKSSGDCRMM